MQPEPQENDSLWALLGNAKKPVLPSTFVDRVMETVESEQRSLQEAPSRSHGGRFSRWAAAGVAAGLLALIGLQSLQIPTLRSKPLDEERLVHELLSQGLSSGDLALVAQLHEVVDAELASLWTESLQ
jgi:hypothetical protein